MNLIKIISLYKTYLDYNTYDNISSKVFCKITHICNSPLDLLLNFQSNYLLERHDDKIDNINSNNITDIGIHFDKIKFETIQTS